MTEKKTPEFPAETNVAAKAREWKATQAYRDGLLLGLPADRIRDSLVRSGECSREVADRLLDEVRDELRKHTAVYRDLEVATTLERLELLYSLLMQKGDYRNVLEVVRERARFTRAAEFVKFTSCEEKRSAEPSEFSKKIEALGPVGREHLSNVLRKVVDGAIEMATRMQAGDHEQEETEISEVEGTALKSNPASG